MKSLIITLGLLSPLAASAATNVTCKGPLNVIFHVLDDRGGIATPGSVVTIVANGVLHTVIDARVDTVDVSQEGKVVANVTTIDVNGESNDASGKAVIDLGILSSPDTQGNTASGAGSIHILKDPPNLPDNLIMRPDYPLRNCTGSI